MIYEPLRNNIGNARSIWLRWLRQEGYIILIEIIGLSLLLTVIL